MKPFVKKLPSPKVDTWPLYNMVFYKLVLFVLGKKKSAGWVIKKSDPAWALNAKKLPVMAFNAEPYCKRSMGWYKSLWQG